MLDNSSGAIGAAQALTITADRLNNGGTITSATKAGNDPASDAVINVAGAIETRSGGSIWADHNLALSGGSITNAGSIAAAADASLNASTIDNSASSGVLGAGNGCRWHSARQRWVSSRSAVT